MEQQLGQVLFGDLWKKWTEACSRENMPPYVTLANVMELVMERGIGHSFDELDIYRAEKAEAANHARMEREIDNFSRAKGEL